MGTVSTIRTVIQAVAILLLLVTIGFLIASYMTSCWQHYQDPGTGDIHYHGLWMDFTYSRSHAASYTNEPEWRFKPKFGVAVQGDRAHQAQAYQIIPLVLLGISTFLAIGGALCACAAGRYMAAAFTWAATMLIAVLLTAAGIIHFYVESFNHRFVNTDKMMEQIIGYSFWFAFVGLIGLVLSLILAVGYVAFAIIVRNRDERPTYQTESRPKVLVTKHHITSL